MDNRYRFVRHGSAVLRSLRDGDFEEEDVWAVLSDRNDQSSSPKTVQQAKPSGSIQRYNLPSAARMIPRATTTGLSSRESINFTPHDDIGVTIKQHSAPVNIPDWPKHCSKKAKKKLSSDDDEDNDDDDDADRDSDEGRDDDDHDSDDDDGHDYRLAPHEFLARRLAQSHISSFSVFEGVGRKLKGRDLSKVRNSVLTKTGFIEP